MCIYFVVIILMVLFIVLTYNSTINRQNRYLALFLSIWCLLFGLRHKSVGNDSPGYTAFFEGHGETWIYGTINNPGDTIEWGFIEISRFLHLVSSSYTFFFFVISMMFLIPMYFYYKDKKFSLWSLLFFIVMSKTFFGLPIMARQTMSIGLVLIALLFFIHAKIDFTYKNIIHNKKVIFGVALFVFSIFVHRTSLILFPLLLGVFFLRINKMACYVVVVITFLISMFGRDLISTYFDLMLGLVGNVSDDNVSLMQARYEDAFASRDFSLVRASTWTLALLLSIWSSNKEDISKYNYKCLIVAFVLYMLLGTSSMGIRISVVFQIIGFSVIVPSSITANKVAKKMLVLLTLVFIINSYSNFESWAIENMDSGLPYYFFWEK